MDLILESLYRLAQKYSKGKTVLLLFLMTMTVYILMLSYSIPKVTSFSPEIPIFDLSPFGYSHEHANQLLSILGEEGRDVYLTTQLPLDFIYPGLFSITYSLLVIWLFGKSFSKNSRIYHLAWVPFFAGVFDYIENILIIEMICSFPETPATTVNVASFFTILKSVLTMLFFVVLLIGIVSYFRKLSLLKREI